MLMKGHQGNLNKDSLRSIVMKWSLMNYSKGSMFWRSHKVWSFCFAWTPSCFLKKVLDGGFASKDLSKSNVRSSDVYIGNVKCGHAKRLENFDIFLKTSGGHLLCFHDQHWQDRLLLENWSGRFSLIHGVGVLRHIWNEFNSNIRRCCGHRLYT